jgi:hypothetical protein
MTPPADKLAHAIAHDSTHDKRPKTAGQHAGYGNTDMVGCRRSRRLSDTERERGINFVADGIASSSCSA